MRTKRRLFRSILSALALCLIVSAAIPAAAEGGAQRYSVTVTNLTRGQIFSPPLVVTRAELDEGLSRVDEVLGSG